MIPRVDPRVQRTRTSLQHALLELAAERALEEITVIDITERAGVNRSSFYQHYDDKDTLLADALENAIERAAAPLRATVERGDAPTVPAELGEYLAHIADNVGLYRSVLGEHGSSVVSARVRGRIELIVRDTLGVRENAILAGVPLDVVGAGIAGSALGVITAWVSRDPLPPVEVAASWLIQVLRAPELLLADEPPAG